MLSIQQTKRAFNCASYKLGFSQKTTSNLKNQGINRRYTLDPQQDNPIYRLLRRERMNKQIFQFLLAHSKQQRPRSLCKNRSYSPNFEVFQKNTRNLPSRQLQRFRSQGEIILNNVSKISLDVKNNKRKLSLLDQYSKIMDKYGEVVPKLKTNTQKQLFIAHQQVQKICKEQYLFKDKIKASRSHFRRFEQPKVNFKMLKQSKKMSTQGPQTVHLDEEILKRTNTYFF